MAASLTSVDSAIEDAPAADRFGDRQAATLTKSVYEQLRADILTETRQHDDRSQDRKHCAQLQRDTQTGQVVVVRNALHGSGPRNLASIRARFNLSHIAPRPY